MATTRPPRSRSGPRHPRGVWPYLFAAGLGLCAPAVGRAAEPDAKPADDPARPFLARHCQSCHTGAKPKGNFRLDALTQDFGAKANRERWLTVAEQIRSGAMPPEGKPRPPEKEVAAQVNRLADGRSILDDVRDQAGKLTGLEPVG